MARQKNHSFSPVLCLLRIFIYNNLYINYYIGTFSQKYDSHGRKEKGNIKKTIPGNRGVIFGPWYATEFGKNLDVYLQS